MTRIPRKSDGRRIFTDAFKRRQIGRVLRGELTIAELSRQLHIARSLLHRWKRLLARGAQADGTLTNHQPVSRLDRDQYIRELELLVGKQTVQLELLRAELDALRNSRRSPAPSRR